MFFTDEFANNAVEIYKQLFTTAMIVIYTLYAVRQIFGFRRLVCGIIGTIALIAGDILIYMFGPLIAIGAVWATIIIIALLIIGLFAECMETDNGNGKG